jgi:hypothetical protein
MQRMEEPLRLPPVPDAQPTSPAIPPPQNDAASMSSTASASLGPVVVWIEDDPQPDAELEALHTRLARVGIELAEFNGDRAALSWAERCLPRVCCAVICAGATVPAEHWAEAAERCVEMGVPLLLAPVLEPDPKPEPEPEPEPESGDLPPGMVVLHELGALQIAMFERVAEKFEFVGGALRPKTASTAAAAETDGAASSTAATETAATAEPLLTAVYVQQPSWRKPPVLPQAQVKRLGGRPSQTAAATGVDAAVRGIVEEHAQSVEAILASVPGPQPPQSTRYTQASKAASRRRLWPTSNAERQTEKPPLRLGQGPQLDGQAELDVKFTVVHGPVVLGNGLSWANRLGFKSAAVVERFRLSEGDTVIVTGVGSTTGKMVEGKRAMVTRYDKRANAYAVDVEGDLKLQEMVKRDNLRRPVVEFVPAERNNVVLATRRDRRNVIDDDVQRGHRHYVLVYPVESKSAYHKVNFDEDTQALALDNCAVELVTDPQDAKYGVLSLTFPQDSKQSSSPLMKDGGTLRFSSLLDDDSAAIELMELWRDRIWQGVLSNRELDAKIDGHVVSTSQFAIVSAPEEEEALWTVLSRATPADTARAFDGCERVSLCCPRMHRQNLAVRKELAHGLISKLDVSGTTHRLVEHVRVLISCEHATLYIMDPIKRQFWAKIPDLSKPPNTDGYPLKKIRVSVGDGVLGEVVKTAKPVFIKEPRKDTRFDWKSTEQEAGIRAESLLCAPILSGDGEVLAVVQLLNKALRKFNEGDLNLLDAESRFGKEVSYVIEGARNVKESLAAKNYAEEGGDWWGRWMEEVRQADAAGQKLIVCSRRKWEHRTEPEDVNVPAALNDQWPGHEVKLKAGEPIEQFTGLQQREIEWLQSQGFGLEFRRIETVDAVRSDLGAGRTYEGEWSLDGKINGTGQMFEPDGKVVKGVRGRQFQSGDRYEGEFLNGHKSGKGTMRFANGDTYEGEWLSDRMHGHGLLDRGGDTYRGEFFEGKRAGQGVQQYTNTGAGSHVPRIKAKGLAGGLTPTFSGVLQGAKQQVEPKGKKLSVLARIQQKAKGLLPLRYEGGWKDDLHHGRGKLTRVNGQWELCMYIEDEVVEVLESGTALEDGRHEDIQYPNGDKYSGCFEGGKMNGPDGKMVYKDGRIFVGDWKDGKRHGYGKMKFPDGRKFDGPWKEDKMDGPGGVMKYPDGRSYRGDWKDSQKHGSGEHTYVEKGADDKKLQAKYVGEYSKNAKHGNGRFEYLNAEVNRWEESEYVDGKQLRIVRFGTDIADGRTKYKWPSFIAGVVHRCIPNGDTYDGDWKGGQMCGRGTMDYDNGDRYEGMWLNNLPHGTGLFIAAADKGSWSVASWESGQMLKEVKKGTKLDATPNIDELCWLDKVQAQELKIIHGPEILGCGDDWESRSEVEGADRKCVIIASQPGGQDGIMDEGEKDEIGEWDERHTIFQHAVADASAFDRELQAVQLEACTFELSRRRGDPKMGVLSIVTSDGEQHEYSSMMEDEDMALKQMETFQDELQAAIERNRDLDSARVVKGARFAVVAFPMEETTLCDHVIYAKPEELANAFEGADKVSICVSWSKEGLYRDAWWERWVKWVREAYSDGQTIVCFDRRRWTERTEPKDVFIAPDTNVDWPGRAIELVKGRPIYRHDVASQRQAAWLRKQCDDPVRKRAKQNWDPSRFEFWQVDTTLDVLRSGPDLNGDRYSGEWSVKGFKHGQGKQVWANGDTYEGRWKHGKQQGQGVMTFSAGDRYEGGWKAGTKHGYGVYTYADGDVYDGEWQHDKEHGRGKYTHQELQRWEVSLWSEGKPGTTIASGKVGEGELDTQSDTQADPAAGSSGSGQDDEGDEDQEEEELVESTALRLEKKLRAMQAKMEQDEAAEAASRGEAPPQPRPPPPQVDAEEPPAVVDASAAAAVAVTPSAVEDEDETPMATVHEVSGLSADEDVDYSTSELIEVVDEMDAEELQHACKHHALPVHATAGGATSVDDMRAALKAHYRNEAAAAAEVPEEDIRAPSPIDPAVAGGTESGELQTFKSQSSAKVAGFRNWAVKRGVEDAKLGRAQF